MDTENHSTTGLTQKLDSPPVATLLWTDHCGHRKPVHHWSHAQKLSVLSPAGLSDTFMHNWLQEISFLLPTAIVNWNNLLEGLATDPPLKPFQSQRSPFAKTGCKTLSCLLTYSTCQQQQCRNKRKSFSLSTDTSEEEKEKKEISCNHFCMKVSDMLATMTESLKWWKRSLNGKRTLL